MKLEKNMSKDKKIVAVIQARVGSTRLPNKAMLHLHGYPIIDWVANRVKWSQKLDDIVFAIPDTEKDLIIQSYLEKSGIKVFAGSESDVLGRTVAASRSLGATHIVRICADNPFIDGKEIDNLIDFYFEQSLDYAYNHIPRNNKYPDGLGAEIVSLQILEKIDSVATSSSQREHTFNYIWENLEQFKIGTFDPLDSRLWHPEIRVDMDNYSDYLKYLNLNVSIDVSALELIKLLTAGEEK